MKKNTIILGLIFLFIQLLFVSGAIFDLESAHSDMETYNKVYVDPQRNLVFDWIAIALFFIGIIAVSLWLVKRKTLLFYLYMAFSLLNIGLFMYSLFTNEIYYP